MQSVMVIVAGRTKEIALALFSNFGPEKHSTYVTYYCKAKKHEK